MMTSHRPSEMVQVLYEDYTGLWSPLERLYFSSSSRILVSRHPLLTMEEVISIYCPQCMARYTDEEAVVFHSKCPLCFYCPSCDGILVKSTADSSEEWKYVCSSCQWSCTRPAFDSKKAFEAAGKGNTLFQSLLKHIQSSEKGFDAERNGSSGDFQKPWHLDDLEKKIESRQKTSLHVDFVANEVDMGILNKANDPLRHQGIDLRSKRTLRCRHDLDAGKMNILVQPKPSPLDGDSSMRAQKGKWWVKDSSAIHEIPFISVVKLPNLSALQDGKWAVLFIRAVNSQEQEGKLSIGSKSTPSGSSYYFMNELGKSEYSSTSVPQLLPSSVEGSSLEISLEGYEDELLKDESEAGESSLDIAAFIRSHAEIADDEPRSWISQSVGNQAIVGIPVKLAAAVGEVAASVVELDVGMVWEHGDVSIKTTVKIKVDYQQ